MQDNYKFSPEHQLLNPEEHPSRLQLPQAVPFNDCTPEMVKQRENNKKQIAVSQFFCSPEPSALMHATPESYSQAFLKKADVFKDSNPSEKEEIQLKALPANKLSFSAAWKDS